MNLTRVIGTLLVLVILWAIGIASYKTSYEANKIIAKEFDEEKLTIPYLLLID